MEGADWGVSGWKKGWAWWAFASAFQCRFGSGFTRDSSFCWRVCEPGECSEDVGGKDVESEENFLDSYKNFVSFSEYLGLPLEGFEKEVDSLLRKLEAWKGRRVVGSRGKRRSSPASQFERELQRLDCFVNYNLSSSKGRQSRKCGLDLVSECPR